MLTSYIVLFLSFLQADASERQPAPQPAPVVVKKAVPVKSTPVTPVAKPKSAPIIATEEPAKQLSELPALLTMSAQPMIKVAVPASADEIVGKVQDFYTQTKSFTASFQQTVTNQTFNKLKPQVSTGKVYILKPGKMRWDYVNKSYKTAKDPKVSKSFISDGKHLWAVMHKNKQYYKEVLQDSTLPVALSFLMGTGDLRKDFDVTLDTAGKYGSKSDLLLLLTPKTPSARYKKLWLVVDSGNYSVKQSVVLNTKGDTNAIRFLKAVTNDGKLKPGHFIFNASAHKDFKRVTAPSAPDMSE